MKAISREGINRDRLTINYLQVDCISFYINLVPTDMKLVLDEEFAVQPPYYPVFAYKCCTKSMKDKK